VRRSRRRRAWAASRWDAEQQAAGLAQRVQVQQRAQRVQFGVGWGAQTVDDVEERGMTATRDSVGAK
jgi:hypothetical protein